MRGANRFLLIFIFISLILLGISIYYSVVTRNLLNTADSYISDKDAELELINSKLIQAKSKFDNDDGSIVVSRLLADRTPDYPAVIAWDKEYAKECDRLSTMHASRTGKKRWGRWFLTKKALVTCVPRPNVGKPGHRKGDTYDIGLGRIKERWVEHMREKNWMGEKGIKDLEEALLYLTATKVS